MCCADFDFDETYCLMSDCICERPLINRKAGEDPSIDKPYRADVDYCLSLSTIDAPPYNTLSTNCFRNCLEGNIGRTGTDGIYLNLLWHQYCGGTMSIPSIAPNDPLFILQATFLDR
ncbi:hypothetical protein GDO81_025346 [Engystomops pustulosus]|uniref:WSC domain-containing protein n=1 Tax=Engystomops pustulosus TaxID=76066 RepID=A0AAV6ZM19_ENGPU|nr:hypothetical protein GDO81_025346 [Engystomops pustulosus]